MAMSRNDKAFFKMCKESEVTEEDLRYILYEVSRGCFGHGYPSERLYFLHQKNLITIEKNSRVWSLTMSGLYLFHMLDSGLTFKTIGKNFVKKYPTHRRNPYIKGFYYLS